VINAALRRQGIGASEVGALFGVDERRDAFSVWLSKKDDADFVLKPNIRMVVGKALERGILDLYTYVTGRAADWLDETQVHPQRPWMVYTPDALVRGERRGVDCKVVFWDQRRKWGATAKDIPERIQLQCAYLMAGLDYDSWDVAALMGEGEPRVYTVERDLELERSMLAYVEEWHRRFIIGNARPPIGGTDEAAGWLKRTFATHRRPDMIAAGETEIDWLVEYAEVRAAQHGLDARQTELENLIKFAIGEHEGLHWPAGKFTWRKTKDSQIIDWQSLALALVTRDYPDPAERDDLIASFTHVKPGYRRIWFDSDLFKDVAAA
jgi:predicted phage-related endonuclease